MLLRKFKISSFSQISRLLTPNLILNTNQQCHWVSSTKELKNETQFIAQFVPNHIPKPKSFLKDDENFSLENDYSNKSIDELIGEFEKLSDYCTAMDSSISEEKYDPLVNSIINKIPDMNDEEVMSVLTSLTKFPRANTPRDRNYRELWNAIDYAFWYKCKYWKAPELLKAMNAFYRLGINKISKFNNKAIIKLSRKVELMDPRMLVEMMFYQSIIRHKEVPMYNVENKLKKVFYKLNLDEIGIIGLAFFKRESKLLDSELIEMFYNKLTDEADEVKDITLVNLAKILRYSSKPIHADLMNKLHDKLLPNIDRFNILTCMHISLLGTNLQNFHQKLIEKIIIKVIDNIGSMRLKDLDRLSLVIALYDFKSEKEVELVFMRKVIEELKNRVDEIVKHPKCFTSINHYLSMKGIYDLELIATALKENFIVFAFGKNFMTYSRDILCLDSFTRINLKGIYNGPQLPEKTRRGISTFQSHFVPYRDQSFKMTHSDRLTVDIQEYAELKFGPNILTQVLPHIERPDIIYCFDENRKSVTDELFDCFNPKGKHLGEIYSKEFVLAQKPQFADKMDKYKMISIVIGNWNLFHRDSRIPSGYLQLKLTQLELIGYIPVVIHWSDWVNKTLVVREELLVNEINKVLSS